MFWNFKLNFKEWVLRGYPINVSFVNSKTSTIVRNTAKTPVMPNYMPMCHLYYSPQSLNIAFVLLHSMR